MYLVGGDWHLVRRQGSVKLQQEIWHLCLVYRDFEGVRVGHDVEMCGLTFELTPTAEAGAVSPVCDDATAGAGRAYDACRSGSGVEREVRRHWKCVQLLK
jgi:hypothetical protein